jgi:hypothetical protein
LTHYSYHARLKQRIRNGELAAIREEKEPFALRFFFTDGTSMPIRAYRVPEYMDIDLVREKLHSNCEKSNGSSPDDCNL